MSDEKPGPDARRGGHNKPPPSGISPHEAQGLRVRIERLEKQLQEHYAEKNQWNSLVQQWVGSNITVWFGDTTKVTGELLWVDRYTFCVMASPPGALKPCPVIVHKGMVTFLHQS